MGKNDCKSTVKACTCNKHVGMGEEADRMDIPLANLEELAEEIRKTREYARNLSQQVYNAIDRIVGIPIVAEPENIKECVEEPYSILDKMERDNRSTFAYLRDILENLEKL